MSLDDRFWTAIPTIPKGVWRVFKFFLFFWKKNDFQKFSPSKWQPSHIFAEHPTPYYESSGDGYQMVYPDVSQSDHPGKYLKKNPGLRWDGAREDRQVDTTGHHRDGGLWRRAFVRQIWFGRMSAKISSSWHFRTPQQCRSIHDPDIASTDGEAIHLRSKRAPERRARGNLSVLDSTQASFDTVGVIAF